MVWSGSASRNVQRFSRKNDKEQPPPDIARLLPHTGCRIRNVASLMPSSLYQLRERTTFRLAWHVSARSCMRGFHSVQAGTPATRTTPRTSKGQCAAITKGHN